MAESPSGELHRELMARMDERRADLEAVTLDRVFGIAELPQSGESDYLNGLRDAVAAAVEYGYTILDRGPLGALTPIPPQLLVQARLAARVSVSLEAILRRYVAGH